MCGDCDFFHNHLGLPFGHTLWQSLWYDHWAVCLALPFGRLCLCENLHKRAARGPGICDFFHKRNVEYLCLHSLYYSLLI